jgi:YD repeat-containing protein
MQAQDTPARVDVIPPSPEASSLGRFGQVPVSLYTGVPQISIPLWTVKEKNLTVPLSITYHAGGNRVADVASRTGLGWTLAGQGVISRSMRGLQDDPYYFSTLDYIAIHPHEVNTLSAAKQFEVYNGSLTKCRDLEPDEFSFNLAGGYSGTFMFNEKKEIVIASASKISIQPTFVGALIDSWTITVEDGTKYIFDVQEKTHIKNFSRNNEFACTGNNTNEYVSSWHLREIIAVNPANKISFTYSDYQLDYRSERSESDQHLIDKHNVGNQGTCCTVTDPSKRYAYYDMIIRGKQLSSITTSSGQTTVELKGNVLRTDVSGTNLYQLNELKVSNGQGKAVKAYQLQYNYTSSRLMLTSLTEINNGLSKPAYQFSYNSTGLPARNAFTQDYWGYYNSNLASTMLLPTLIYYIDGEVYLPGADRSPDATKMQALILQQITYPTGGTTQFTFEPHSYSYKGQYPLTRDGFKEYKKVKLGAPEYLAEVYGSGSSQATVMTKNFTVTLYSTSTASKVPVRIMGNLEAADNFRACSPRVTITKVADGSKVFEKFIDPVTSGGTTLTFDQYLLLTPGTYTMTARAFCSNETGSDHAKIEAYWENETAEVVAEKMAGGLRLKQMVDYDGMDHSRDQVTTYDYTIVDQGKTLSSGSTVDYINFYSYRTEKSTGSACNLILDGCGYLNRVTNSALVGYTQGSPVGYRQVTVYKSAGGQQGKTVYQFTSPYSDYDIEDMSAQFPFPPRFSREYARGLLTEQSDYRYNSGNWALVKKVTTSYGLQQYSIPALKIALFTQSQLLLTEADNWRFTNAEYFFTQGYSWKEAENTYLYDASGQELLTTTTYQYNNQHRQLSSVVQQQSDGSLLTTKLTYPADYTINTASGTAAQAIKTMQTKHMHSPVIEKQQWLKKTTGDPMLLSSTLTLYQVLTSGDVTPSSQWNLSTSAPLAENTGTSSSPTSFLTARVNSSGAFTYDNKYLLKLTYERYDANSQLQQVREANNISVCYLWGYKSNYPVAEIKDASYGDIVNALGQTVVDNLNNQTGTDEQIRQTVQTLRSHAQMKNALITTYTYDPLKGTTSVTDPSGKTMFYDYDDLQRLLRVKDRDGNIVQKYQYHYKGQSE